MKNIFLLFLLFSFFSNSLAQEFVVKSLNAYTTDNKLSFPVVTNDNKLIIEFDVQGDFIPNMNAVFRFCDKYWKPTDNIFLLNQNRNIAYFLDFKELPHTVKDDARYHFKGEFPDKKGDVEFPFSGNWRFYLTDTQDTSLVYASGKFFVVDNKVQLISRVKRDELEDKSYWPVELAKVYNVTTDFTLPNEFHPGFVDEVEIIENQRIYNPIIIDRKANTLFRKVEWDADRKFTFIARDIHAGNEFRQVDIRDHNRFIGKDVNAQFDGLENSRFFLNPKRKDLNGGKIYADPFDAYSTYLNVTFSIRPPDEVYGDVFLVGAFNNWKLSLDYKMNNNDGIHSITIPLKRGIFDYQYVVADVVNDKIENADWLVLEGNTWLNKKEYDVFLYYNEPDLGGYDRIIGFVRLTTD